MTHKIAISADQTKVIAYGTYRGRCIRGVAKCHPNDNVDLVLGQKIAELRMEKKLNEAQKKTAEARIDKLCEEIAACHRKIEKLEAAIDRTEYNLDEIVATGCAIDVELEGVLANA